MLVEDELRVFNLERLYAGEKGVSAATIVESARTLPMMGSRRVVVLLRGEKLLKSKRRKGDDDGDPGEQGEPPGDLDALAAYATKPEPLTTLVIVASDITRTTRVYKALQKHATIVECWGLKGARDGRIDLREVGRQSEQRIKQAVMEAGQQIEPAAAKLLAERAGADIATLRGDLARLLLYAAGKPRIELKDVQDVVSGETSQDVWAVNNAIQRGDRSEALRQLALALESGGVSYMILGQLAHFVREKLPGIDPRRVPAAVEALFRTDVELKSSGGDPRVLLERLVVDLCRR